jgi:hypothetical protein
LLKFLHTMGAIGLTGTMAALLAVMIFAPPPRDFAGQAAVMSAMARIATWILMPSLGLTLIAGLVAIPVTPGYIDAGWVWAKAITGILIFEGGFVSVLGPIQAAAKTSVSVLARQDPAILAHLYRAERNTIWALLAVAVANVALGIWRPRLEMPM